MTKNKMPKELLTSFEFSKAEPLKNNPLISKVKIKIAEPGRNRNKTIIRKSVLLKAARETLGLAPIVAYYSRNKGDFGMHGEQVDKVEGGYILADTQAFGVIPENPEVFWEDGFLAVYGYMWTERYPFLYEVMKKSKHHSMELDEGRTVIGDKTPDGYYDLPEIAFKGLCILGDDVEPAFAESRATLEYSTSSNVKKDVDKLIFSLGESNGPDFLVENLSREQLEAYVNRITDTINRLDKVASESESPENVEIIDDIITKLVDIESELKGEPKLVPLSEKAIEALQGEPTDKDGIVTNRYQIKEDFSSMTEEEKRKLEQEKAEGKQEAPANNEEEVKEETPVEKTEEPAQDNKEEDVTNPGGNEGESPIKEEGTEKAVPGSEAEGTGEGVQKESPEVGTPRESANLKRAKNSLGDIATDDLLEVLIQRLGNSKEAEQRLVQALDIDVSAGSEVLPENAESVDINTVESADISGESVMTQEADASQAETLNGGEGDVAQLSETSAEVGGEITTDNGTEDNGEQSEPKPEEQPVPAETEPQKEPEGLSDEEKEKKKKEFSLNVDKLIAHAERLESENKSLREFKLGIERKDKEAELLSYSLTEEKNEEIRGLFDTLTLQEVSEKAAYAHYRQSLETENGQKSDDTPIEFSLNPEESLTGNDSYRDLINELKKFK